MLVPGILNGSGINGTAASDVSKNERTYLKSANTCQVFVAQIARERTIKGLAISRRKRWRYSREIIEEVVAAALIISAELWKEKGCMRADDTRGAWIRIGIDEPGPGESRSQEERVLIKWRSRRIWSRVRKGRVHTG